MPLACSRVLRREHKAPMYCTSVAGVSAYFGVNKPQGVPRGRQTGHIYIYIRNRVVLR